MSYFINKYTNNIASSFSQFIVPENGQEPSEIAICGHHNGQPYSGILVTFDKNGTLQNATNFTTGDIGNSFVNGVICPNGDYLMYGSMARPGNNRSYNTLIRMTTEGEVIWAKRLHSDRTRNVVKLVALGEDRYVVAAWYNTAGSSDDAEFSLFDGTGTHIRSVKLGNNADNQISNLHPWGEGFVAIGNTSAGPNWDGFIVYYNRDLEPIWKKLLGTGNFEHIEIATTGSNGELILVGTTWQNASRANPATFFARLTGDEPANTTITTVSYNITVEQERNRKIIRVGNLYYLTGYQTTPLRSYVVCLDEQFNLLWTKYFETEDMTVLNDMIVKGEELWFCGNSRTNNTDSQPILIKTNLELTTCKTTDWGEISKKNTPMTIRSWNTPSTDLTYHVSEFSIEKTVLSLEKKELCPIPILPYFINKYPREIASYFSKFIVPENGQEPTEIVVCGFQNGQPYSGILTSFDENGNIQNEWNYPIEDTSTYFSNGVTCPNGDYLLYGVMVRPGNNRAYNILVRLKKTGETIWAKRLHSDRTRNAIKLIALGEHRYIVAAWNHTSGSRDDVELSLFDGTGHHIRSVKLGNGADDQISNLHPWGEGFVVLGNTSAGPNWDGFIAYYNRDVEPIWKKLLGTGNFEHIKIATTSVSGELILVGTTWQNASRANPTTFFARLNGDETVNTTISTVSYQLTGGEERNRKIIRVGDLYYAIGYQPSPISSYVICLDEQFNLKWLKYFKTEDVLFLSDIIVKGENLWFCGNIRKTNTDYQPVLIKTNLELTSCKTENWGNPSYQNINMAIRAWNTSSVNLNYHVIDIKANKDNLASEKIELCPIHNTEPEPIKPFERQDNYLLQSPYLNIQAAGSLGQDSTAGILLRWLLLGDLGEKHLPKGNLAQSTVNYNKPNDFVCIYRAAYPFGNSKQKQTINLQMANPFYVHDIEGFWVYKLEQNSVFYLYFKDLDYYQTVRQNINPNTNSYQFLESYGDKVLELEIKDDLAFAVEIEPAVVFSNFVLKAETYSVPSLEPLAEKFISGRNLFSNELSSSNVFRMEGEHICSIQFSLKNAAWGQIHFETYQKFFKVATGKRAWKGLGQFALTSDDAIAKKRLEPTPDAVNKHWKRFNDGRTVQVDNYEKKWSDGDWSLKKGVEEYVKLSDDVNNAKGSKEIGGTTTEDGINQFNLLDLLQIAAVDYHIARMLGLGHIDTSENQESQRYIYLAEYNTKILDEQGLDIEEHRQHLFMTPPVSTTEQRLPQTLKGEPPVYGLEVQNGTTQAFQLTNADGYTPDGQTRYVRLHAKLKTDYLEHNGFFNPPIAFSLLNFSAPVLAGIEYKKAGETGWRPLEIAYHNDFPVGYDKNNPLDDFETPVLSFDENASKPLFIHKELETGIHQYAFYSVNLFSRSGSHSDIVSTDATQFFKRNTLMSPSIKAQLIQEEYPLLLTTKAEQDLLISLNGNKTLVRVLCKYNQTHDQNYDFADKIEFFFRDTKPLEIMGKVISIQNFAQKSSFISTSFYKYDSNDETVLPNIVPTQVDNFVGGTIVINEKQYIIEEVITTNANGDNPSFKIQKIEDRQTHEIDNTIFSTQNWEGPDETAIGTLFSAMENMSKANSWGTDNPLDFTLQIGDSDWVKTVQTFVDEEGKDYDINLRGIWDTVNIPDPKEDTSEDSNDIIRIYTITFDNFRLKNHPQFSEKDVFVQWFGGTLMLQGVDVTKEWDIWEITGIKNQKYLLYDTNGNDLGIKGGKRLNIDDGNNLKLIIRTTNQKIRTGNIKANFYPNYLVYLYEDDPHNFNEGSIFPTSSDEKTTILGARSVDSPNNCTSDISTMAKIRAEKVIAAKIPNKPVGPLYATPPDIYNKSSYTAKFFFTQEFYQAIFYRADINSILRALYQSETLKEIKAKLLPFTMDEYFMARWQNLLSFDYTNGTFDAFPLIDATDYALPNPDNIDNEFNGSTIFGSSDTAEAKEKKLTHLKDMIWNVFLPLTEQPLYFDSIKEHPYQAIPKKQTIRNSNGDLLPPDHADFDQAPMANRIGTTVQFTDFTLDGGMNLDTAYCYFAREIGNKMDMGQPSIIMGPVQLLDKSVPSALQIRKVSTQLAQADFGIPSAIRFEFLQPPVSHRIEKVRLYRSLNPVDALSVRMMTLVKTLDLNSLSIKNGIVTLIDDFEGETIIPYGAPLHYRLIAVKMVQLLDEQGNPVKDIDGKLVKEEVPSYPTKAIQNSLVDTSNPEPPTLTANGTTVGNELTNLVVTWNKTTYNATYRLLKMTSSGTWHKIYEVLSNEANMSFSLNQPLLIKDEDNQAIYHRFKVSVENSSGLLNVEERILTISS